MNENEYKNEYKSELRVRVAPTADTVIVFAGFPLLDGQWIDREEPCEGDTEDVWYIFCLGDKTELTGAQEQFLDTNPHVVDYEVT